VAALRYRETVEQIKENPYLQYFIGMSSYSNETPFDPSMLVHFREKISASLVNKVNQAMVKKMLGTASSIGSEKEIEGKERLFYAFFVNFSKLHLFLQSLISENYT